MALPDNFIKYKIKSKKPLVSIVIPVYNEQEDIGECINSITNQTYKRYEVIIVDDGSTDNTVEIVKKYKSVRLIKQNHKGPGEARNLGAKKARGEILILIDADMVLFPDYVEKLINPLINEGVLGTIESIQYNLHRTKMQECWGKVVRTTQLEGVNSATVRGIARKDFLNLGGFDRRYGYADDRTFFLKYGVRFLILPDVKCYHKTPSTFKGVFKHSRWIGASLEKGLLKYKQMRAIAPFFMLLFSPIAIPLISAKKCHQNGSFHICHYMLLFIIARYFGTAYGMFRRSFIGINYK